MPDRLEETFHRAAVQLIGAMQGGRFKSVVFTSCRSGAGTTTAVYQVTQSLRDLGMRPLMLEVNRRKPAFARLWHGDAEKTLDRVAAGSLTLKEAIQVNSAGLAMVTSAPAVASNGHGNGHVVRHRSAGGGGGGGGGGLTPSALRTLIAQAEAEADVVLIDAPPVLDYADAMLIATAVPRVLLVVESGVTTAETIAHVRKELEQRGIEIVGAILNKQKRYIPSWFYRMVTR